MWADKMDQQVKMPTAKPEDLSSISRTYVVQGENELLQFVFCPTGVYLCVCVCKHVHTHTKLKKEKS